MPAAQRRSWPEALLLLCALLIGCGHTPRGPAQASAILVVQASVGDADIYLDGVRVGAVEHLRGGVSAAPGPHRLEVRHDDYFSYYQVVEFAKGQRQQLQVELAPILR